MFPVKPLFDLDANEVNDWLPQIKKELLGNNDESKIKVLKKLTNFLDEEKFSNQEDIVKKLIDFDMLPNFCDILHCSFTKPDTSILIYVLEIFDKICQSIHFYRQGQIIPELINALLRLNHFLIKSDEEEHYEIVGKFIDLFYSILMNAIRVGLDITNLYNFQQALYLLKDIEIKYSSLVFILKTSQLLNIVCESTKSLEIDEGGVILLLEVCQSTLKLLIEAMDEKDTNKIVVHAICQISNSSIKFCMEQSLRQDYSNKLHDHIQLVNDIVSDIVIHHIKNAYSESLDPAELPDSLTMCMSNLFSTKIEGLEKLSNHLVRLGFLKYFLDCMLQRRCRDRKNIALLLSRILNNVCVGTIPTNKWVDGSVGFLSTLQREFVSLSENQEEWIEALKNNEQIDIGLLILAYFHYHGTLRRNIVTLDYLIVCIKLLSRTNGVIPVIILKPLWFLFAILSMYDLDSYKFKTDYIEAEERLISILSGSEIHNCYTHHPILIHYCLKIFTIPNELTSHVMNLWLIESDGDVTPLLEFDFDHKVMIRYYLKNIVNDDFTVKLASLAFKTIENLISLDESRIIAHVMKDNLPIFLNSYFPQNVSCGKQSEKPHIRYILLTINCCLCLDCYKQKSCTC